MSSAVPLSSDFARFQATFFEECAELLPDLEERVTSAQAGAIDSESLNAIFRAVHSIKAGAAAFGFTELVDFAHVFETLLDKLRSNCIQQSRTVFNVVLRAGDLLAELVDAARCARAVPQGFGASVAAELKILLNDDGEHAATAANLPSKPAQEGRLPRAYKIVFQPYRELFRYAKEPLFLIRELRRLGELSVECIDAGLPELTCLDPEESYLSFVFHLITQAPRAVISEVFEFVDEDCLLSIEDGYEEDAAENAASSEAVQETLTPAPRAAGGPHPEQQKPKGATFIRVDLSRVDRLVNMVGELVITQAMLAQQLTEQGGNQRHQWAQRSEELAAHTRQLQECVMAIRMQPVRTVFTRMPRLVRDISAKLGKKVQLVTSGDQTEVDKTVIEELADPITHMIRNAIDHGIEDAATRLAAGKSEEAIIELSASQRGGNILITIADDGAGIDRLKVLRSALSKGIIGDGARLTDDEIHNLLFAPGFSTAAQVTEVSGRGVGLDVVRRNISNLGGRIQIQSTPGKGTRFTLIIPLTLAVLDGMLVAAGNEKYIIPLTSVVESIRPERHHIRTLADGSRMAAIRGELIRLISLHDVFDVPGAIHEPWKALTVIVETQNGMKSGLIVDELIGQQQVVVKSLLDNFNRVPGVSGATILGDGRVALILDLDGLCALPERRPELVDGQGLQPLETDEAGSDTRSAAQRGREAEVQEVHASA